LQASRLFACLLTCCAHLLFVMMVLLVADSLLGDGCRVMEGSVVKNSVLGSCAYIDKHCYIQVRVGF
jgi:ADP-glucose pyrophosphorylase